MDGCMRSWLIEPGLGLCFSCLSRPLTLISPREHPVRSPCLLGGGAALQMSTRCPTVHCEPRSHSRLPT